MNEIDMLVTELGVAESMARIVAGTKTLHHLLPDLVPPMDRAWTGAFFGWNVTDPQYHQRTILTEAFGAFTQVARSCRTSRPVGSGWNTSATKLLDNALIGYCKLNCMGPTASVRAITAGGAGPSD